MMKVFSRSPFSQPNMLIWCKIKEILMGRKRGCLRTCSLWFNTFRSYKPNIWDANDLNWRLHHCEMFERKNLSLLTFIVSFPNKYLQKRECCGKCESKWCESSLLFAPPNVCYFSCSLKRSERVGWKLHVYTSSWAPAQRRSLARGAFLWWWFFHQSTNFKRHFKPQVDGNLPNDQCHGW